MNSDGKQLVQCMRAVSAFGQEINALCETLNDLLVQEIARADLPCRIAGRPECSNRMDDSEWIYTDVAYSLPLVGKRVRKDREAEMYLGYQVSFSDEGISLPGNEEPLLHVCLWTEAISFDDENSMGYPLMEDDECRLEHNRLIAWGELNGDWKMAGWTFSLRLLSLNSSQDLLNRVVKPAIALLKGEPVTTALAEDLPGLVFYSDENVLRPATEA